MKKLIVETANGRETIGFQSRVHHVKTVKGAHYRVVERKGEEAVLADGVIATREGAGWPSARAGEAPVTTACTLPLQVNRCAV